MRHPAGSILKYNRLWRAGQHYSYIFFKVSHETAKGTIMGHYIDFTRTYEDVTHDYSTERWIVSPSKTRGKVRRLPHPGLWDAMTEAELETRVCATSCVY